MFLTSRLLALVGFVFGLNSPLVGQLDPFIKRLQHLAVSCREAVDNRSKCV